MENVMKLGKKKVGGWFFLSSFLAESNTENAKK